MNTAELIDPRSLAGRTILVAAGWAPEVERPGPDSENENLAVDEAVLSLGRAVFARGGQIALIGEVDLALLLAMVAGEYGEDRPAEDLRPERERPRPPVIWIDPREAEPRWEGEPEMEGIRFEPDPVRLMEQVGKLERRFFPSRDWPTLLFEVIRPDAVVCVGSPAGLESADLRVFREAAPQRAYALATTGGLAAAMADGPLFRTPDLEFAATVQEVRLALRRSADDEPEGRDLSLRDGVEDGVEVPRIAPFPLVAQAIAEDLGREPNRV